MTKYASGIAALIALVIIAWFVVQPTQRVASRIYIDGQLQFIDKEKVAKIATPYLGQLFFDVDIKALAKQVEQLPWVASARVKRQWPDGVRISISEQKPVAQWNKQQILTANYTVITPQSQPSQQGLPKLAGPKNSGQQVFKQYKEINQALSQAQGPKAIAVKQDRRGAWQVQLENNQVLYLGRKQLHNRLQRFIHFALAQNTARILDAAYIDLRYQDGFAVGGHRKAGQQEEKNDQKA